MSRAAERPGAAETDAADRVLALARRTLGRLGLADDDLGVMGPPLVSAQAVIYFLGVGSGQPSYVAKVFKPESGVAAVAQYQALERCYAWWKAEDSHAVAKPIALLADGESLLMQHIGGRSVSHVLGEAIFRPAVAATATRAAGDFLRRFHAHARVADAEVALATLVAEIRASEGADLASAGLSLPDPVKRALDRVPSATILTRRVRLHGDYTPRNLILTGPGEVAMIDPVLREEGLPEDDIASFLTLMSSASVFASGLVLPRAGRVRRSLEQAFLAGYGPDALSPVICELRLIHEQMWRWTYRRRHRPAGSDGPFPGLRAKLVDAQMAALLEESAARLDRAIAAMPL